MTNETCPGNIRDFRIIDYTLGNESYRLCSTQRTNVLIIGFNPSPDFCPSCPYSMHNVESRAEKEQPSKTRV